MQAETRTSLAPPCSTAKFRPVLHIRAINSMFIRDSSLCTSRGKLKKHNQQQFYRTERQEIIESQCCNAIFLCSYAFKKTLSDSIGRMEFPDTQGLTPGQRGVFCDQFPRSLHHHLRFHKRHAVKMPERTARPAYMSTWSAW